MATNTFPATALQDLDATRGTATQRLNNPSHVTHHDLEDQVLEALQTKVGIDSSAVTTSLDYILKNTTGGHDHDGTDSKTIPIANLSLSGLSALNLIRVNAGATALEGLAAPSGDLVGTTETQTLTNKTLTSSVLTTPQINDTSADHQYVVAVSELAADRTITFPLLTAADTFVFQDFIQTLTNKTLTTPIISSISNTGTLTLPTSTDTLVGRATTDTLTNKRITKRVTTITSHATPTVNSDNCDVVTITAQAEAITSMTTNLSGTPTNFQTLIYRILDDGTGRAITWGASFVAKGVALPTTTTASKLLTVGLIYDTVAATWGCVASATEA